MTESSNEIVVVDGNGDTSGDDKSIINLKKNKIIRTLDINNDTDSDGESDHNGINGVLEYNDIFDKEIRFTKSFKFHQMFQNKLMSIVLSNSTITQLVFDENVMAPNHIFCIIGDATLYSEIVRYCLESPKMSSVRSLVFLLPQGWVLHDFTNKVLDWLTIPERQMEWDVKTIETNYSTENCKDIRKVTS
jgi:hypothetical protein